MTCRRAIFRPAVLSLLAMAALSLAGCGQHGPSIRPPELVFGSPGEHDGQFHMPREVGFSPDGRELYILDRSHRVQVFTPGGEFLRMWPTPYGPLGNPRGLDVDKQGDLYVADTHNSQILVYTPQGKLLRKWGRYGKAPGQFISVTDVSLDPDGNVWTCEYGAYNDRIQKFTSEGKHLLTVGTFGDKPGQFSRPQGLAVDPRDGRVYVADAVNHRIQVLAPDGKPERMWGEPGAAPGKLRYPYDVCFDPAGRLFVAEYGNSRVSVFTREGKLLAYFGKPGHRPGEFDHPWGVNVARTGEVYVADTMNYRVQKFPPLWQGTGVRDREPVAGKEEAEYHGGPGRIEIRPYLPGAVRLRGRFTQYVLLPIGARRGTATAHRIGFSTRSGPPPPSHLPHLY